MKHISSGAIVAAIMIALCFPIALGTIGCAASSSSPSESRPSTSSREAIDASTVSDHAASADSATSPSMSSSSAPSSPAIAEDATSAEQASSSASTTSAALSQVSADIQALASASGMSVGVAAIDLMTGEYAGFQGFEKMASASMIKLLIAHTFLGQVKAGAYSLQDSYILQSSDIVGGTGTLAGLGAGASVTYGELVDKMISVSDNTAANVLIDACGMDEINADAAKLGLAATQLNRYMMDTTATAAGIENYTSADDIAVLLKMVWNGTFIDTDSSALVLAALEGQQDVGGILNGLPAGVVFAHKTGSLATVRHDGGIVEGERPYVLVVLCGGSGFNEQGALDVMAQIGAVTYSGIVG